MDVICHGTPSPKLWKKYVEYQENRFQSKMCYVSFRNKDKHGWDGFGMKETFADNNEIYISRHFDPYFSLFVGNICLRPSCFQCIAKYHNLSDITVSDFWGINNIAPEMNDDLGISLVITRTDKGQKLFDSIDCELCYQKVSYEDGVRGNKSEYQSYEKPVNRERFFIDMNKISFDKLSKKYLNIPLWKKIGHKGKTIIKKFFK